MYLIYCDDKRLRESCRPVECSEIDFLFHVNIVNMIKKMKKKNGLGLSAPQIGDMRRYFVFKNKVAINPEILEKSLEEEVLKEGCLSFPDVYVLVSRSKNIKVKYMNLKLEEVIENISGIEARVFAHELDHLNGITIIEREIK